MCEEEESHRGRSKRLDMVMGQLFVFSGIKIDVPLENDDPAYQNIPLQQYEERIERLSQSDKVSKFCMDAGFLSVAEIGQYFMTKDTGEHFLQWPLVYTLFQGKKQHRNRKAGSRETQKVDPCWKLRTFACMVNMESILEFGI